MSVLANVAHPTSRRLCGCRGGTRPSCHLCAHNVDAVSTVPGKCSASATSTTAATLAVFVEVIVCRQSTMATTRTTMALTASEQRTSKHSHSIETRKPAADRTQTPAQMDMAGNKLCRSNYSVCNQNAPTGYWLCCVVHCIGYTGFVGEKLPSPACRQFQSNIHPCARTRATEIYSRHIRAQQHAHRNGLLYSIHNRA